MDKHEALDWFLRRRNMQLADKCQSAENIAIDCIMQSIANEWISVKEKLPGLYECVLIATTACNANGEEFVSIGVREKGEWKCLTGPMTEKEFVTHWMPLPGPPMKAKKTQRDYEAACDMRDYCEHCETTYNPEDGSL